MGASLLPNAKQQFLDQNGKPLSGGNVYMYVPATTTAKTTWQDSGQTTPNANPVPLDSSGEAIIFGVGQYRQIVKDSSGATIWDQLTADPGYGINTAIFSLSGLTLSNDSISPNTVLDIAAGSAQDSTGTYILALAGAVSKTTGAFAAGSGNGGLFSGAIANNTWYNVFLIRKTSDGTTDTGFSTSITAADIPAGYAGYRRIGAFRTDGSAHIIGFFQLGDWFFWTSPKGDLATDAGVSATWTSFTLTVPTGLQVMAFGYVQGGNGAGNHMGSLALRCPNGSDIAPDTQGYARLLTAISSSTDTVAGAWGPVLTNSAGQIQYYSSAAIPSMYVGTRGWVDNRGK